MCKLLFLKTTQTAYSLQFCVYSCIPLSDFVMKRNCTHRFLCHRLRIGIKKNYTHINFKAEESTARKCTSMSSTFSSLHNFLQITEHFYLKWIQHSLSCDNDLFWLLFHRQ